MNDKAKSCPFCGKHPEIVHEWNNTKFYACINKKCELAWLQYKTEDGGIREDEWNKRPEDYK